MFAFLHKERGQAMVMAVLLVPVLLGMAGMAVDVGSYSSDRRELQRAADAIALAAAKELPDVGDTNKVADQYAVANGLDPAIVQVVVTGGNTAPKVSVTITRAHDFAFMPVVGVDAADVGAKAAAVKVSLGGNDGVVPWAIEDGALGLAPFGQEVVLKYDANNPQNGNFGPIRVDGSDATAYEYAVKYGSTSDLCSVGTAQCDTSTCPGSYPSTCAETSPECDGPDCGTKPGNMTGPTRNAVDFRINYTTAACDTFTETFTDVDNDGLSELNPECNPWVDGPGRCDSDTDICSRRVFIIPVIDEYPNGSSEPVTILRFALVFLEGYPDGRCGGSFCEIRARFVKAELTTNGLSGTYDENAPVQFIRLTE